MSGERWTGSTPRRPADPTGDLPHPPHTKRHGLGGGGGDIIMLHIAFHTIRITSYSRFYV
ncbi:hypothetical protein EON65_52885 [archaeon]|nr:MAG: hypothetical protein EON65_52885 [archaeon]